jgi:hypothetical protein
VFDSNNRLPIINFWIRILTSVPGQQPGWAEEAVCVCNTDSFRLILLTVDNNHTSEDMEQLSKSTIKRIVLTVSAGRCVLLSTSVRLDRTPI